MPVKLISPSTPSGYQMTTVTEIEPFTVEHKLSVEDFAKIIDVVATAQTLWVLDTTGRLKVAGPKTDEGGSYISCIRTVVDVLTKHKVKLGGCVVLTYVTTVEVPATQHTGGTIKEMVEVRGESIGTLCSLYDRGGVIARALASAVKSVS